MCTWCIDPSDDVVDDTLCRMHEAEVEGFSISMLDKRDEIQHAEWLDTQG